MRIYSRMNAKGVTINYVHFFLADRTNSRTYATV